MATIAARLDVTAKSGVAGSKLSIANMARRPARVDNERHSDHGRNAGPKWRNKSSATLKPFEGHDKRQAGTRSGTVGTSTSSDSSGGRGSRPCGGDNCELQRRGAQITMDGSSDCTSISARLPADDTAKRVANECGETGWPMPHCSRTCGQVSSMVEAVLRTAVRKAANNGMPVSGVEPPPIVPEHVQVSFGRQHEITVFPALTCAKPGCTMRLCCVDGGG